jgi:prepilin-type processing-associated H-X9-DG protein
MVSPSKRQGRASNFSGPSAGLVTPATVVDGLSQTAAIAEILVGDRSRELRRIHWQLRGAYFERGDYDVFTSVCRNHAFQVDQHGQPMGGHYSRGRPWTEQGHGSSLYNHFMPPNAPSCVANGWVQFGAYTPASNHPAGVQVLFADGHLRMIEDNIELNLWRAMGSCDDHLLSVVR